MLIGSCVFWVYDVLFGLDNQHEAAPQHAAWLRRFAVSSGCLCAALCCRRQVLAHMPLSLHSMEVVNRLAASGHLPEGVVHLYVSNCINSCDDIKVCWLPVCVCVGDQQQRCVAPTRANAPYQALDQLQR